MMQMKNKPMSRTQWGMPQARYSKAPSKVVSIPVQFIDSESERNRDRTDSAIKIQKVVRGFLVRNSMKKIAAIRVETEKIERNVCAPETVELMRREHKERVRVSETIMDLLLKLDSVSVLHYPGLRDCRKSIIKKAIALQEMVDQIEGPTEQNQPHVTQAVDSEGEKKEALGVGTSLVEEVVDENCLVKEEEEHEEGDKMEGLRNEEEMELEDGGCVGEESVGTSLVEEEIEENCLVKEEEEEDCKGGRGEEGDRNRELLEKMVEENEKMMGMMAQLFQRNEMQTRLLNSLSNRVEQLEKAFACEKLRRKKRKSADAKHKETQPNPKNGCI